MYFRISHSGKFKSMHIDFGRDSILLVATLIDVAWQMLFIEKNANAYNYWNVLYIGCYVAALQSSYIQAINALVYGE